MSTRYPESQDDSFRGIPQRENIGIHNHSGAGSPRAIPYRWNVYEAKNPSVSCADSPPSQGSHEKRGCPRSHASWDNLFFKCSCQ